MFQIIEFTEARVASVSNRIEKHGDEDVPAVSLAFEVEAANTLLDVIDPQLRHALYKPVDGQDQLPGVELSTPVLRCNSFDKHALTTAHEGWTLAVDDNIDENDPMVFGGCKVDKFVVDAKQGGSIVLKFRVGTSDVDADKLGQLAMHNGQAVWIKVTPPEKKADAIDGSNEAFNRDHPNAGAEPDATDLFAAGAGTPGPDDDADDVPPDDSDEGSEGGPVEHSDPQGTSASDTSDAAEFEAGAQQALAAAGVRPKRPGRSDKRTAVQ